MAKNLRAKIPASDTLLIHDINTETTEKFMTESDQLAKVEKNALQVDIAECPREVAERSVSVY